MSHTTRSSDAGMAHPKVGTTVHFWRVAPGCWCTRRGRFWPTERATRHQTRGAIWHRDKPLRPFVGCTDAVKEDGVRLRAIGSDLSIGAKDGSRCTQLPEVR